MTLAFAAYDEVWDDTTVRKSKAKKRMDPACALYKKKDGRSKMYDNIIDSYLETDGAYDPSTDGSSYANSSKQVNLQEDAMNFLDVSPKPYGSFTDKYKYPRPQPCYDEVAGLSDDSTAKNAMEFERYYDDNNMFQDSKVHSQQHAHRQPLEEVYHEEEQAHIPQEYMHIPVAPIIDQQKSIHAMYIELSLFVIGGILLIFIMEQVLHMGVYLR